MKKLASIMSFKMFKKLDDAQLFFTFPVYLTLKILFFISIIYNSFYEETEHYVGTYFFSDAIIK